MLVFISAVTETAGCLEISRLLDMHIHIKTFFSKMSFLNSKSIYSVGNTNSITKKLNYIDLRRYFFLAFCTLQTHTIHADLHAFLSISTVNGFSKYIVNTQIM